MERLLLYSLLIFLIIIVLVLSVRICTLRHRSKTISSDFLPLTLSDDHSVEVKLVREEPRILIYRNFLSPKECEHLIELAEGRFNRSHIQTSQSDKTSDVRTSYSCYLENGEDEIVKVIEARASTLSGLPHSHLEPLQLVRYHPGQFYKFHYDFFVPGADGTKDALTRGGQRRVTFFVYLNDLPEDDTGGHTFFDKLDYRVKPVCGTAVFWLDCGIDGKEDYLTHHAGESPTIGIKYGLNIWFREKPYPRARS